MTILSAYPVLNGEIQSAGFVKHPIIDKVKEQLMHPDKNPEICKEYWNAGNVRVVDEKGNGWYLEPQDEETGDNAPYPVVLVSTNPVAESPLWEEHYIPFCISHLAKKYVHQFAHGMCYIMIMSTLIEC